MHVFFATAELAPHSTGGLAAELCGALPKGLRALDHHVTVLSPLYAQIDPQAAALARRLTKIEATVDGTTYACELYTGRTVSDVSTIFIGHEELFRPIERIDDGTDAEVAVRASVFAQAVAAVLPTLERTVDVLHAHGWIGGAILAAIDAADAPAPHKALTLYTREGRRFTHSDLPNDPQAAGIASADVVTMGSTA